MLFSHSVYDAIVAKPWYIATALFSCALLFGALSFFGESFSYFVVILSAVVLIPALSFRSVLTNTHSSFFVLLAGVMCVTTLLGVFRDIYPTSLVFEESSIFLWGAAALAACAAPVVFSRRIKQLLLYTIGVGAPTLSALVICISTFPTYSIAIVQPELAAQYSGLALILLCLGLVYMPLPRWVYACMLGVAAVHTALLIWYAPFAVWISVFLGVSFVIGGYEIYVRNNRCRPITFFKKAAIYTLLLIVIGMMGMHVFGFVGVGQNGGTIGPTLEILAAHYSADMTSVIYGNGPGTFPYAWNQYFTDWTHTREAVHREAPTTLLTLLFTNGLVVGILFIAFVTYCIYTCARHLYTTTIDTLSYVYVTAPLLISVYIGTLILFTHVSPGLLVCLGICMGLSGALPTSAQQRMWWVGITHTIFVTALLIFFIAGSIVLGIEYRTEHLIQRGLMFREHGALDMAARSFMDANEIRPRADALRHLAETEYTQLSQTAPDAANEQAVAQAISDYGESAVAHAQEAVEINGADARNWEILGSGYAVLASYSISGATEEAEDAYIKALAYRPWDPVLYYKIGIVYAQRDDIARAEAAFTHALRLDPSYSEARAALENL